MSFKVLIIYIKIICFRIYNKHPMPTFKKYNLRLELGFGLLPIVSDKLENNLQTGVQKLREDIKNEYGIYIPFIHIVDFVALDIYEYSFFLNKKSMGKFRIKTEDINNSFNSESIKIILINLNNIIINNLVEIFSCEYSNQILNIKKKYPKLFKCVLKNISLSKIKFILSNILSEKKSLVNIEKIFELIISYSREIKDVKIMSEMIIENI